MNSKRVYFLLLGLIGILIASLIGGAYGVNSMLQSRSDKLVAAKLQNQVLTTQQAGLVKEKKEVQQYAALNDIAQSIVPQDKDQAEAVREISNLAAASGIGQLSSVTFPLSTLGGPGGTATSSTGTSSSSSTKLTQLKPVNGLAGVYQLQITIQQSSDQTIPYSEFITFLSKLEQNRRTAQVSSISLSPDSKNPSYVGFTLIINEFIRP